MHFNYPLNNKKFSVMALKNHTPNNNLSYYWMRGFL